MGQKNKKTPSGTDRKVSKRQKSIVQVKSVTIPPNPFCLGLNQIQADDKTILRNIRKKYNSHQVMLSFASAVSYHI